MNFRDLVCINCSLENFLACYYHELCENPTFLPTIFYPILILIQERLFRISCSFHAKPFFFLYSYNVRKNEEKLAEIVNYFFEVVEICHAVLIEKVEDLKDSS